MKGLKKQRQPKAMVCVGMQGGGKTYTTTREMEAYKKKYNRPVLIVDINNEYGKYKAICYDARIEERDKRAQGFLKQGSKMVKRMGIADINRPLTYRIIGVRPDDKPMSEDELIELILTISDYYTNGALILEEMNTYVRRTVPRQFYGFMIRLRHRGVDLVMHYQAISDAHPDIWAQTKILRLHRTMDSVTRIKQKIPNFELVRIAEFAVEKHYLTGKTTPDGIYYFLYVDFVDMKILGISLDDFKESCERYLYQNKDDVRNIMREQHNDGKKKYPTVQLAHNKLIEQKMHYIV